ncbi:MAG: phosphatase PAP2 family protein [Candidatus Lokiarchaeota archaeon]|nr:phosphatase PAP2 family protein [Candidatus Lokiarchaeota archaeon]
MNSDNSNIFKKHHYLLSVLLVSTSIALIFHIIFYFYDVPILEYFGRGGPGNNEAFGVFFDDFGQNPSFIFVGIAVLFYFVSFIPGLSEKLAKYRVLAAYVFFFAGFGYLFSISFKTFFARPRPGDIIPLGGELPFVHAWEIGTESFDDAYHASFPSGHTFAASLLYSVPFLFLPMQDKKKKQVLFTISISLVTIWCILMGAGRVHDNAHFPSDTLWSTYIGFMCAYVTYFFILKVEDQIEAGPWKDEWRDKSIPLIKRPSPLWAFSLLITLVLMEAGCLVFAIGIKELLNAALNLNLPMLTQYLADEGITLSPYIVSAVLIGVGGIFIGMFLHLTKLNMAKRPSEVVKKNRASTNVV